MSVFVIGLSGAVHSYCSAGEYDLPHAVHVRRLGSATQPRTEAFLWCLSVHIVCAKKKAETKE